LTTGRRCSHPIKDRGKINSNQLWIDKEDLAEVNRSNVRRRVIMVMVDVQEKKKVYLN